MPYVSSKKMLEKARRGNFAIAAFNIHNLETFKAVTDAAEEIKSPLIIQTTPGTCDYIGIHNLVALCRATAKWMTVPVTLHLDHARDLEMIYKCIDSGYSSVMFDGSNLSFEDNIKLTKKVVDYAKKQSVQVEAELGKIGGIEDDVKVDIEESAFTDPEKAKEFVEKTEVDSLAIAIGTAHGTYKGDVNIDYDRLKEIASFVKIPLVLHGSSGVPDEMIKKAVSLGICKINISTEIKQVFTSEIKRSLQENPEEIDPRKYLRPGIERVKDLVKNKIHIAGSVGKL